MSKMKCFRAVLSVLAVAVLFTCVAAKSSAAADSNRPVVIGCSMAVMTNPFYVAIKKGMDSVLKSGDRLNCVDAKLDGAKQLNDVEDMIQQGVDMILLDPVDSKGVRSILESAKKAGIPVIAFNNAVENGDEMVASTIVSDNEMAGKLCGQSLAKAIGDKGDIAILDYNIVTTAKLRANGFVDEISKNHPNIKIVNRQEMSAASTDIALPIMENILQSTPEITGVFAINDPAAIGAIAAIENSGRRGQIQVCGVDGSDDAFEMIKAGKMLSTAAQFPAEIGEACINSTYSFLSGDKLDTVQMIPVAIIDATNIK